MSKQSKRRRSIRLKGFDYSRPGAYFLNICAQERMCLFGRVIDGHMELNDAGRMVARWWDELNRKFPTVRTDLSIVMPNHLHGIILIVETDPCVRPDVKDASVGADLCVRPREEGAHAGAPLPEIVQWFKTMTTNDYIRGVRNMGWMPFPGRLWQRNYYERIIRDEDELNEKQQYIIDNPRRWSEDPENPGL